MTQAALVPLSAPWSETAAEPSSTLALSAMVPGDSAWVVELALEPELAGWLRAVGIGERERITVLRRAAFGGPIHVRTGAGGEFALHRTLAASVLTRRLAPDGRPLR